MSKRCNLCHTPWVVETVTTDLGPVEVAQCMVCDRSKCGQCNRPVAGTARVCPYCRASVWWPPETIR